MGIHIVETSEATKQFDLQNKYVTASLENQKQQQNFLPSIRFLLWVIALMLAVILC